MLAAAYLSLNPPRTEPFADRATVPVRHRYEWLVPVLLVDAVFLVFLVAQATVVFGGHDYLESTTGLTYADYVHQGFGQLTVATALTLLVVWAAARKAPRETSSDRTWLRSALGLLCVLTLVVVASALYRMHVYQEAYGFTRLRLLVDVFEGWLGLLVLGVMAAGVGLRGGGCHGPRSSRAPRRCWAWRPSTRMPGSRATTWSATRRPTRSTSLPALLALGRRPAVLVDGLPGGRRCSAGRGGRRLAGVEPGARPGGPALEAAGAALHACSVHPR